MDRRVLAILLAMTMILPPFLPSGQGQETELVLRVAMQDDMRGTNPLTVSDIWSNTVLQWIYESPILVDYDSKEIMPYIAIGSANLTGKAESWNDCDIGNFGYSPQSSWSDSGKQEAIIFYDFTNVTWHDGTPMTVRDVMFSHHLAAQVPEWSSTMNCLKDEGGAGGNFTSTGWLHIYKVWEEGNRAALKFVLQQPYANFFGNTMAPMLLPYHIWGSQISGQNVNETKIWCDQGFNGSQSDSWQVAPAQASGNNLPIGSGIFEFGYWEKGQMSRIDTYRGHFYNTDYSYKYFIEANFPNRTVKQPTIDAITFQIFKTAEAAVWAMKSGDIDYISWPIPPTFFNELANEPGISLWNTPEAGFFYLSYNMRRESFGYNETGYDVGKPLRRAISHCIDKNKIVQRMLLNMGLPGHGPVSYISPWYNKTIPTYAFDPDTAKRILADAGYKVNSSGTLLSGEEAFAAASEINFWVNPDGSPIGSNPDGKILILTPESNYDPIRAQTGMMIAQQLRDIGIKAESVAMDFGIIVDIMQQRNFDMYILGWRIGSEPTDYLHSFFHSSNIEYGPNYPGYRNESFDALIDLARQTGNETLRKKLIFEAQAAICYDLPYDVLYYRTNIYAATTEKLIGWIPQGDNIFNRDSIVNLRGPYLYDLHARFSEPPSAVYSNSSTPIMILVTGDNGEPMEGASVTMETSIGNLSSLGGTTNLGGQFRTTFTAPYVPPTPENIRNGTLAFIRVTSATCDNPYYSPSPPRYILVTAYPEEAKFINIGISADPDIIEDLASDRTTPGFTNVVVEVTDQGGVAVQGATVNLTSSGAIEISPVQAITDRDGKVAFKVTAANISADDGSVTEYGLMAQAIIEGSAFDMKAQNYITIHVLDVQPPEFAVTPSEDFPAAETAVTIVALLLVALAYAIIVRRKNK